MSLRGNDKFCRSNLAGHEIAALSALARNDVCATGSDLLDKHSGWSGFYSFVAFIQEFERTLTAELDFKKEGANIIKLADNLKYFEHIHLPKVYWPYSTGKVLALERIRGERLSPDLPKGDVISREHLAEEILEAYLKQIVQDGFFHADPHLGNLLFEPDGRVGLIDLGVVGQLDADLKFHMGEMLLSFAGQDAGKTTGALLEIGAQTEETDTKALEQDIRAITSRYSGLTAADLGIGRAIIDLAKTSLETRPKTPEAGQNWRTRPKAPDARQTNAEVRERMCDYVTEPRRRITPQTGFSAAFLDHKLRVPHSFNLLGKTLFYVDVIIKQLAPDMKYMDFMKRSTQRVFANLWQSQYTLTRFTEAALETNKLILDSPARLNLLLDKLVKNEVTIRFEHEHLDGLIKTLRQGANRLAYAVVVASIIVGSALIMRLRTGQEFFGYSFLGVMGFLVAGLLGIYLLIRILRAKRL